MGNQAYVIFNEFAGLTDALEKTGEVPYGLRLFDDYGKHYINLGSKEDMQKALADQEGTFPVKVVKLIKEYGTDEMQEMLDFIDTQKESLEINDTCYEWADLKDGFGE